ncbi:phospholipase A2 Scol/Pla isoform X2 [Macrosteles quadrilineatus]|uniref:phospholipase A2 Scol/Pla isoform X2 n=1 Tax=Macrosteles quadrilineatus TaxID=74068 RepID=UPI0023E2115F|nr:phospholipase A2 Scol/Pla isoform X2 [Macrosteles quadrilineatus]
MTPGGALSWIPILILVAPIMGYSERINTIEENEVTNSTRFQVFVGYSSDPWGASSELEFDSVSDQLKGSRKCCKMHDWCYSTSDCPMFLEYFVPYYWTCYRHQPLCALGSSCGQRLCECDRRLAECLSHYPCPRTKAVCTSSPWRLLQNILML